MSATYLDLSSTELDLQAGAVAGLKLTTVIRLQLLAVWLSMLLTCSIATVSTLLVTEGKEGKVQAVEAGMGGLGGV